MRCEVFQRDWVSVARLVFQACLIDRSSISPFRINNLRAASLIVAHAVQIPASSRHLVQMQRIDGRDESIVETNCDRPRNLARSLTAIVDGPGTISMLRSIDVSDGVGARQARLQARPRR
jgi:hypothetical protein